MLSQTILVLLFQAPVYADNVPCWKEHSAQGFRAIANVPYQAKKGEAGHKLDLYIPNGIAHPKMVMLIHGGCFKGGGKDFDDTKEFVNRLVGAGYAVASVDYTLVDENIPESHFPASLHDVQDAATSIQRDIGPRYGLDTSKMAAFGYSAGATLAMYLNREKHVQNYVDFFGRMDFKHGFKSGEGKENQENGLDCGEQYVGKTRDEKHLDAKFGEADVLSHLTPAPDENVLVVQGCSDKAVNCHQSERLVQALKEKRINVQYVPLAEGVGHMFTNEHEKTPENEAAARREADRVWTKVCSFLNANLGKPEGGPSAVHMSNARPGAAQ